MENSKIVIKVKYENMLRRFNAQVVDKKLCLDIDGLRKKIFTLFNFAPDSELTLTYIDEDGDVVTLVDDDDLRDVLKQGLNPIKITVKVSAERNSKQHARSSGCLAPLSSPRVQRAFQKQNMNISEIKASLPEPLRETFLKLSTDLTSMASSSLPAIAELFDHFSKMGISYLGQLSGSKTEVQPIRPSGNPDGTADARDAKALESLKSEERSLRKNKGLSQPKLADVLENNRAKPGNTTAGSMDSSLEVPSSRAVGAPIGSQSSDVEYPYTEPMQESENQDLKPSVMATTLGKEKNAKKIKELHWPHLADNVPNGKDVNKPNQPHLGSKPHISGSSSCYAGRIPFFGSQPVANNVSTKKEVNKNGKPLLGSILGSSTRHAGPMPSFSLPHFANNAPTEKKVNEPNDPQLGPKPCILTSTRYVGPMKWGHPDHGSLVQNDAIGSTIHLGVACDGCGAYPITGPRLKSKVKKNYDLCDICFARIGNDTDYIAIGHAVDHQNPMSIKGLHGHHAKDRASVRIFKARTDTEKLDSCFIQDMNIADETVMVPSIPFTKIWRMRNSGTSVWPQKTQLVWTGGDRLSNAIAVEVEIPAAGLPVGQDIDVAVDLVAPEVPGRYISHWRMASPSGIQFGQHIWVHIQVAAPENLPSPGYIACLDLSLPPLRNTFTSSENFSDSSPTTMVHDEQFVPTTSKRHADLVESLIDAQPNNKQEVKFSINDTFLVGGGGVSNSVSPVPASSSMIDLSQASMQGVPDKYKVEEKLLRELEEMGFKQIAWNKEILRISKYNLQHTVDYLCHVSEQYPFLPEPQEGR